MGNVLVAKLIELRTNGGSRNFRRKQDFNIFLALLKKPRSNEKLQYLLDAGREANFELLSPPSVETNLVFRACFNVLTAYFLEFSNILALKLEWSILPLFQVVSFVSTHNWLDRNVGRGRKLQLN